MKRTDAAHLVFLDESAANTKMGRSHAWIRRGSEMVEPRPMNWGKSLTMIGAIRLSGGVCLGTHWGAITADSFLLWCKRSLFPKLRRGDIVVMDNAKAHKDVRIARAARARGVKIRFLPPYSPDLNPIEPAWAVTKKHIRAVAPRDDRGLRRVARRGFKSVRWQHCHAWFLHAGYRGRFK